MQNCSNSIANTLELLQYCTKPSIQTCNRIKTVLHARSEYNVTSATHYGLQPCNYKINLRTEGSVKRKVDFINTYIIANAYISRTKQMIISTSFYCGINAVQLALILTGSYSYVMISVAYFNSSPLGQNGRHFADNTLNAFSWVKMFELHRQGDKPLSEPMMVSLLTHICVSRPQLVKPTFNYTWINLLSKICHRNQNQAQI